MTEPTIPAARRLDSLTGLRAFAALAVFLYHAQQQGIVWPPLAGVRWGYAGVTFFFILSGFVLTWGYGTHVTARGFWLRRAARVYPVYLLVTVASAFLAPAMGSDLHPGLLISHLTLLQAWVPGWQFRLNGVGWSLSDEAFFYLVFPALAATITGWSARRRAQITAAVLIGCTLVSLAFAAIHYGGDAFALPVLRIAEFMLGITLALAIREGWRPRIRLGALVAALVLAAALGNFSKFLIPDYLLTAPLAALIVYMAVRDLDGLPSPFRARWLVYAGEVSYCFYLVHHMTLSVLCRHVQWPQGWVGGALPVLVAFVISAALAAALHHGVELPGQRLVLARSRRQRVLVG